MLESSWSRKPEKVGSTRWFHYIRAVREFDRHWTIRCLGDLYQCITSGLVTKSAPLTGVKTNIASSSSSSDPAGSKESTGKEESCLKALRRAWKNTMELRIAVFSDESLQDINRIIAACTSPFEKSHGKQVKACRSRSTNLKVFWEQLGSELVPKR